MIIQAFSCVNDDQRTVKAMQKEHASIQLSDLQLRTRHQRVRSKIESIKFLLMKRILTAQNGVPKEYGIEFTIVNFV